MFLNTRAKVYHRGEHMDESVAECERACILPFLHRMKKCTECNNARIETCIIKMHRFQQIAQLIRESSIKSACQLARLQTVNLGEMGGGTSENYVWLLSKCVRDKWVSSENEGRMMMRLD